MSEVSAELTPSQIVAELDKYIVGQKNAKRAVAIALRNRYRRRLLSDELRDEVIPKNILMIGPTGVGKTEIARRLALLTRAPFIKIEATKFTEVGYVGRDVDSIVRDLVQTAIRMLEQERLEEVQAEAEERAIARIADVLKPNNAKAKTATNEDMPSMPPGFEGILQSIMGKQSPTPPPSQAQEPRTFQANSENEAEDERNKDKLRSQIKLGMFDDAEVEIMVEEGQGSQFMQVLSVSGLEDMDLGNLLSGLSRKEKKRRKVTVAEAKKIFTKEEAHALIDRDALAQEAIQRTEQTGIVFLDEIDKIARTNSPGSGPDVSREGVQRDILPIIEGCTVNTKFGPVKTDHILFIAAGAFHVSKPSDLIPELQGRLPIRVEMEDLTEADFKRILTEPRNALIRQYIELIATEGVVLNITDDAVAEVARIAAEVNRRSENIGARRLHTILERMLEEVSFNAPDLADKHLHINGDYVRFRLDDIVKDEDLSKYIL